MQTILIFEGRYLDSSIKDHLKDAYLGLKVQQLTCDPLLRYKWYFDMMTSEGTYKIKNIMWANIPICLNYTGLRLPGAELLPDDPDILQLVAQEGLPTDHYFHFQPQSDDNGTYFYIYAKHTAKTNNCQFVVMDDCHVHPDMTALIPVPGIQGIGKLNPKNWPGAKGCLRTTTTLPDADGQWVLEVASVAEQTFKLRTRKWPEHYAYVANHSYGGLESDKNETFTTEFHEQQRTFKFDRLEEMPGWVAEYKKVVPV